MKMNNNKLKYQAEKRLENMCCFGTRKYDFKNRAKEIAKENNTNDWLPIFNNLIRDKIFFIQYIHNL